MPVLFAVLWGALAQVAGSIAIQVFVALGISVITYVGVDLSLTFAKNQAIQSLQGMPSEIVGLMSYLGIGVSINIICSAMLMRATLNGLSSGKFKTWVKT